MNESNFIQGKEKLLKNRESIKKGYIESKFKYKLI